MTACISLARADTGSGALDWYQVPVRELSEWAMAINELEKTRKKRGRK